MATPDTGYPDSNVSSTSPTGFTLTEDPVTTAVAPQHIVTTAPQGILTAVLQVDHRILAAIIGGAVGAFVSLIILFLVILFVCRSRRIAIPSPQQLPSKEDLEKPHNFSGEGRYSETPRRNTKTPPAVPSAQVSNVASLPDNTAIINTISEKTRQKEEDRVTQDMTAAIPAQCLPEVIQGLADCDPDGDSDPDLYQNSASSCAPAKSDQTLPEEYGGDGTLLRPEQLSAIEDYMTRQCAAASIDPAVTCEVYEDDSHIYQNTVTRSKKPVHPPAPATSYDTAGSTAAPGGYPQNYSNNTWSSPAPAAYYETEHTYGNL